MVNIQDVKGKGIVAANKNSWEKIHYFFSQLVFKEFWGISLFPRVA